MCHPLLDIYHIRPSFPSICISHLDSLAKWRHTPCFPSQPYGLCHHLTQTDDKWLDTGVRRVRQVLFSQHAGKQVYFIKKKGARKHMLLSRCPVRSALLAVDTSLALLNSMRNVHTVIYNTTDSRQKSWNAISQVTVYRSVTHFKEIYNQPFM